MRLKARSAICNLIFAGAAEQSAATPGTLYTGLFRSPGTRDAGARLNLMLNQYKVGGKGDDAMQFFQIPYGETRQIRRKGDGSGGSSKKHKRGAAVSQGDEGLPPDDGEAEGGGKSAGDGEEIAASFAV